MNLNESNMVLALLNRPVTNLEAKQLGIKNPNNLINKLRGIGLIVKEQEITIIDNGAVYQTTEYAKVINPYCNIDND